MASRRTISYIGLWALIMPWLGFSWGTKTVLFSLTGILLLVIGNRHYHSSKSKPVNAENTPKEKEPEAKKENPVVMEKPAASVYKEVPEYMNTAPSNLVHKPAQVEVFENPVIEIKEEEIYTENHTQPKAFSFESNPASFNTAEEKPKPRKIKEMVSRKRTTSSRAISLDSLDTENNNE